MRIERIHIDGFGRLRDFDSGADPLGPLVVVLGPNEAGKSTLFHFLTTALYGFSPAGRDTNPHVPWGTNEAGGRIQLRTDGDECLVVRRKLRSSPTGTLTRGESALDLRNQPLEFVRHVPRTVFRQVFAVTLAELAGLEDDTWGRIQDRVLVSMGASDLASARDVADVLEREAGEIWRPNRRGNQRLRELRDRIRQLRGERAEAAARDREIRALMEERERVALRLEDVRRDLKRDRIVVERIQELLPLKRQLDRIDELRRAGGARAALDGCPLDLEDRIASLDEDVDRLRGRLEALDANLGQPTATIARFDSERQRVLEHAAEIRAFLRSAGSDAGDEARRTELQGQADATRIQIEATAAQLFETPLDAERQQRISVLSTDLLRDRIERLSRLREEAGQEARNAGVAHPGTVPSWVGGLCLAVGAGVLVWGLVETDARIAGAGAALLVTGTLLVRSHGPGPAARDERSDPSTRVVRELNAMIAGLELRPEYLSPPALPLVSSLERLREQITTYDGQKQALDELEERRIARRGAADALGRSLGRPAADDPLTFLHKLEDDLREAERARDAAEQATGERERLLRARETTAADLDRQDEARRALLARVIELCGESGPEEIQAVQHRIDTHARADRLEEDLEQAHPDLDDRKARIRAVDASGASWAVSEDELTERRVRIEEAEQEVEQLVGRLRALERDVVHLRGQETVDAIDGALDALREEDARLVTERDRKWVLARLIREADRRFREEHQPDLVRRASDYLRRLTDGRYERLLVDERSEGDLFHLVGPALPRPVPLAAPISTGTLEQAYLALRLAIVDHLDQERERLPLFIDEAFVNWDAARRDQGLEVLAEVSRSRQVFAFTCHPEMADRLVERGGRMVRLER